MLSRCFTADVFLLFRENIPEVRRAIAAKFCTIILHATTDFDLNISWIKISKMGKNVSTAVLLTFDEKKSAELNILNILNIKFYICILTHFTRLFGRVRPQIFARARE